MTRPFEGVRILDFTQLVAGPYATYQLALLGADVVKIERREGEPLRNWDLSGTPQATEWSERGLAPTWHALNAGKRGLALDLQKPEAIEIVKRLAAEADVVMENFRPGVMDRLGIGYEALGALNPRLIYCAVSAFGQTGPERLGAGYDGKMQAMSGLMAMTGHEATGPTRVGFALCDVMAGATAAFGISSALFQRSQTGRGQLVDVSMLEAALSYMSSHIAEYTMAAGHPSQLLGNKSSTRFSTTDTFRTGDGHILFAVVTEKQFAALTEALGCEHVLHDPRFANEAARRQNEPALRTVLENALATRTAAEWEPILNAAGAPCSRIWTIEEVVEHPQIAARRALCELDTAYGPVRLAGLGFKLAHGSGQLDRLAPTVGEHSNEILANLGYSPQAIAALRDTGVI